MLRKYRLLFHISLSPHTMSGSHNELEDISRRMKGCSRSLIVTLLPTQWFLFLHRYHACIHSHSQTQHNTSTDPKQFHMEGQNEYNIWYNKFQGDDNRDGGKDREAAENRCNMKTDAGFTKADLSNMHTTDYSKRNRRYFCIHFAHGMCAKGEDCAFYHRTPLPEDDAATDELFDCFGRQRHAKHRDDMNGTGSFMKPCRTLFVGNLLKVRVYVCYVCKCISVCICVCI